MGTLTEKQLNCLQFGFDNNVPVSVFKTKNGRYQAKFSGNVGFLQEVSSKEYRLNRLTRIAESLTSTLLHSTYSTMATAEASLEVKTAKKFCRTICHELGKEPCVDRLKRQLLATRLAIPLEAFDANPGFYEFASKNYLYHYMRHYGHELIVDKDTYQLKILCEGSWRNWVDVREMLTTPLEVPQGQLRKPWVYGPRGAQNKDLYCWKELNPFHYEDPKQWGERWLLEVCACNESSPQKNGDHSWFRLRTPTGEVYSIGLYRHEKSGIFDNLNEPLRSKKGHLQQPDLSEYYPCNIHAIQYEITEEIFLKIKAQVEEDKRKDAELFQALGLNCTQYVNKIAKIAGIKLPTKMRIWRFLTPKPLERICDSIAPYIPAFVKKVCNIVAAFFLNTLQVLLGANKHDPSVINGVKNPEKPHIHSFWDLFSPEKASLHHPHTLGFDVYRAVISWREKEAIYHKKRLRKLINSPSKDDEGVREQIRTIKKRIKDIPYDVPPEYKI